MDDKPQVDLSYYPLHKSTYYDIIWRILQSNE